MTTMEMLKLAEEIADLHGVQQQFSKIFIQQRYEHGVLSSMQHALQQLNLMDAYYEYSRES